MTRLTDFAETGWKVTLTFLVSRGFNSPPDGSNVNSLKACKINRILSLTLYMLGKFSYFCCHLLTFFKIKNIIRPLTENLFSYFSTKTYFVGTQKNRLNETVLLSTQNIRGMILKFWSWCDISATSDATYLKILPNNNIFFVYICLYTALTCLM